jgi:hypothetical protein
MNPIRLLFLVLGLVVLTAAPARSQEFLRPLNEYVTQYVSHPENAETLRYVARRCGVTLFLISTLPESQAQPEMVEDYSRASTTFIDLAVVIEESHGLESAEAVSVTQNGMENIGVAVKARLDRNLANTGSYLLEDLLIRDDIVVCTGLSKKLTG